jgi:hypothetical protein
MGRGALGRRHRRLFGAFARRCERRGRKVSVHVPAYNEPPDMLIETLDALARLDYPNFEVLVIDNNTRDEVSGARSRRIASGSESASASSTSPRWPASRPARSTSRSQTAADAEVIAVIDSDYKVEPNWLLGPGAELRGSAHRDRAGAAGLSRRADNAFKAMCYAEYRGFFYIGMITRNERNAIIQHGTMTLVRRYVLWAVGGWAEWCITEDAELGLRVFEAGYEALYIAKQLRLRGHARHLHRLQTPALSLGLRRDADPAPPRARAAASGSSALTAGQRYHFIAGWLPWIADGFNLLFNIAAIGWSTAMILAPQKVDPPLMVFSVLPLSLFTFKLVKLVHLYTHRVGMNFRQTGAAAISGLALAHTIGLASAQGTADAQRAVLPHPKQTAPHRFLSALAAAREETLLMMALWACAIGIRTIAKDMASPI